MRPKHAVLATLLFAPLPALAHADQMYSDFIYTGTVLLNGYEQTYFADNPATITNFVNLPIAASVDIRVPDGGVTELEDVALSLPDDQFDPGEEPDYLNFPNCFFDQQNCNEVYFNYDPSQTPLAPTGSLFLDGGRTYHNFNPETQIDIAWKESFSGNLTLATAATPEPSTFALLGTGLLGLGRLVNRRSSC